MWKAIKADKIWLFKNGFYILNYNQIFKFNYPWHWNYK